MTFVRIFFCAGRTILKRKWFEILLFYKSLKSSMCRGKKDLVFSKFDLLEMV